jgi:hypothetical protein
MPAAAAVRVAQADTYTPSSKLDAVGSTEINGHADTSPVTRMGPPRPRTAEAASPPLSPARVALVAHLQHLSKLAAECDRTSKPVDRLREQLSAAMVELGNAEHVLAGIDAQHSAAIAAAARSDCCSAEPVESADAEANIARSRRHVNSVRQALDECAQDQIKANQNLESARTHFDRLALNILIEEHHLYLDRWAAARDAYHIAEIELVALHEAIGQHGRELQDKAPGAGIPWLQKLEALRPPWNIEHGHVERGGPREVSAASGRWSAVLHRLKSDPGATF